jgi:ribosomal protein S18 acetylase RimI-like enzyme
MEPIALKMLRWHELEAPCWQALVREGFHEAFLGIGEAYGGVEEVEGKIAAMSAYPADLMVCAAWSADQLVGLLVASVAKGRLVIYDLFVSTTFRRQGIARQLIQLAIREHQVSEVAAEVNQKNTASQALFEVLHFERTLSSDWFVLRWPRPDLRGSS